MWPRDNRVLQLNDVAIEGHVGQAMFRLQVRPLCTGLSAGGTGSGSVTIYTSVCCIGAHIEV